MVTSQHDAQEIWCWVQPNAKTTGFVGMYQNFYKIRLQAPAIDGKANEALIRFLAGEFDVSNSAIEILAGHAHRQKKVRIQCPINRPGWL